MRLLALSIFVIVVPCASFITAANLGMGTRAAQLPSVGAVCLSYWDPPLPSSGLKVVANMVLLEWFILGWLAEMCPSASGYPCRLQAQAITRLLGTSQHLTQRWHWVKAPLREEQTLMLSLRVAPLPWKMQPVFKAQRHLQSFNPSWLAFTFKYLTFGCYSYLWINTCGILLANDIRLKENWETLFYNHDY